MFTQLLAAGLVAWITAGCLLFGGAAHFKAHYAEKMAKAQSDTLKAIISYEKRLDGQLDMIREEGRKDDTMSARLNALAALGRDSEAVANAARVKALAADEMAKTTASRLDEHFTRIAQNAAKAKSKLFRAKTKGRDR